MRPGFPRRRTQIEFMRAYCGGDSRAHQCGDVGRDQLFQALQVVAALEHRDNPAAGAGSATSISLRVTQPKSSACRLSEASGSRKCASKPAEMRISSGANFSQLRQDHVFERGAEFGAAVFRGQRRVDDGVVLAALAAGAGAGKQRHLVRRAIHHGRIGPEDILGAVAVMDVEIDDRRRARCRICAGRGARRSRRCRRSRSPSAC